MEPISSIVAAGLSTLAGKLLAGSVVAAASVAGMDAANIADVPGFQDEPKTVVVAEDTPQDADAAEALAEEEEAADEEDAEVEETEAEETEAEETEAVETDVDDESGEPNANAEFGQTVAEDAQDGGVDGQVIAGEARAGTPAEDRAAQPGTPEGAGSQADDVRQDDTAGEVEEAEETEETDEPAPAAAENRPAEAGSQADTAGRP